MKYYFRVKMLFVTFTLGLVGVWIFADSHACQADLNLRQPSETLIVVPVENAPAEDKVDIFGGGASGGTTCDEARAEALRRKKKFSHPNCE